MATSSERNSKSPVSKSPVSLALLGAAVLGASLLSGCTYYDGRGGGHQPPTIHEVEPNGNAWNANWIGSIGVGDHFLIEGHVSDIGPDLFDGFAFQTFEPCDVEFRLYMDRPGSDLDLCVYDPDLGGFAFCFETSDNPEIGWFSVNDYDKEFHLVVESYFLDSWYTLEVFGLPLTYGNQAVAGGGDSDGARLDGATVLPSIRDAARLEDYHRPVDELDAREEPVLGRGFLMELDLESGEVRRTDFEFAPGGLRPAGG